MTDDELWARERSLWLGGADAYDPILHPDALMAFPEPAGVMTAPAILEGIRQGPRWAEVTLDERRIARPAAGVAVLAYAAAARRDGAEPYRAYCTSTYVSGRLVQHQQTPR